MKRHKLYSSEVMDRPVQLVLKHQEKHKHSTARALLRRAVFLRTSLSATGLGNT